MTYNYTEKGDSNVNHKSKTNLKFSDFTSEIEGQDLGELRQIWKDIAASESRMNLMTALKGKKIKAYLPNYFMQQTQNL